MESLAVVNAGASKELLSRRAIESARWTESACAIESAMKRESLRSRVSFSPASESFRGGIESRSGICMDCVLLRRSIWEETVNELIISSNTAANPRL